MVDSENFNLIYYFNNIKAELLTKEEEERLFINLKPCQEAMGKTFKRNKLLHECFICKPIKEKLVISNLRYVVKIAKTYESKKSLSLSDLIQEGNLGLIKAISKFNIDKGYRFTTYATWWIRQYIVRALGEQSRNIRLPINKVELASKVLGDFRNKSLKEESLQSFMEREKYKNILGLMEIIQIYMNEDPSLDSEFENDNGTTNKLYNLIESGIGSAECQVLRQGVKNKLEEVIKRLPDKINIDVISRRFGLIEYYGSEPQTLECIGKVYGVTRERIRQREYVSLQKMKWIIEHNEEYSDLFKYI